MKLPAREWMAAVAVLLYGAADMQAAVTINPGTLPDWTGWRRLFAESDSHRLPAGVHVVVIPSAARGLVIGSSQRKAERDGSYSLTVTVTDTLLTAGSRSYTIVTHPAPGITTASLPKGVVGAPYSQTIGVTGGTPPCTFSTTSGVLPSGLTLNASTGAITGSPGAAGSSTFTINVADHAGAGASQTYTLTVSSATPNLTITTTSPLPGWTVGAAYAQTLAASGGAPPYSWSVSGGALPAGLALNASNRIIAGTPITPGSFSFTVRVTDRASATAPRFPGKRVGRTARRKGNGR